MSFAQYMDIALYDESFGFYATIGRAGRRSQVIHTGFAGPDHPLLPHLAESGYLKAVFFRL